LVVEEIGMTNLYIKYLLWGNKKIPGIDSGTNEQSTLDDDEDDKDEENDDDIYDEEN